MDTAKKTFIYALVFDDFRCAADLEEGPERTPFYIGRTSDTKRRLQQHRSASIHGTEEKYVFIRTLNEQNLDWDMEILREVDTRENPWELWYVLEYIKKGCSLKNMRLGDVTKLPEKTVREIALDKTIKNIEALKLCVAKEGAESANRNYEASEKAQVRAIKKTLRWRREGTVREGIGERRVNIWDFGPGTEERAFDFYMKRQEIAESLAPLAIERHEKEFEEFRKKFPQLFRRD
jgi:hypothetical protein